MADPSQFSEAQLALTPPGIAQAKVTEVLKFKNMLQELTHKAVIGLPEYTVTNEGSCHAPCFRATVEIYGKRYTSTNVFKHRKEAEQEAARLALEDLGGGNIEEFLKKDQGQWTIEEARSFLPKLATSWKSIFHEFAIKEGDDIPLPEYCTVASGGTIPYFVSDAKYKEVTYTGTRGKSKKEAEQLAAYVAIQNLLDDDKSAATLLPIIKSKAKHLSAMHGEDPASHTLFGINNTGASTRNPEKMADMPPLVAQARSENVLPVPANHGFSLPIEFVPASGEQEAPTSSKKRRKNRRAAKKRARSRAGMDANALAQGPSVSQPMGVWV